MLVELGIRLLCFGERFVEHDLLRRYDLLRSSRLVVGEKLVVRELEDSGFPDLSVDGATVGAGLAFSSLRIDLLDDLCTSQIVNIWLAELLQKCAAFLLCEQNSCASFTNLLQDTYNKLQVADVECWEGEANMSEMTITVL